MHCQHSAQPTRRIRRILPKFMRIPKLNVGGGLDHDLGSRPHRYCLNPVIQVVDRDNERIGTDPTVGGWLIGSLKFRRSIEWNRIVKEISREVVKVITRLPPSSRTVHKIWQHGG